MEYKITGNLIDVCKTQSGTGAKEWKNIDFVIETIEQYPKKVCLTAWNDKVSIIENAQLGCEITASFNPESREYNGKWYTSLKVWKIGVGFQKPDQPVEEIQNMPSEEINDLPF